MKPQSALYKTIVPILTDISLRNCDNTPLALSNKQELFHKVITTYSPNSIELGSLSTPNSFNIEPIIQYANDYKRIRVVDSDFYIYIHTLNSLKQALDYNVTHMSFSTSISYTLLRKNEDRSMYEVKSGLNEICNRLSHRDDIRKKLYISCISECPYAGPLNIDYILHEICMYHYKYSFDELCLSDTCGTLTFENYKYLVDALYVFGLPKSKIGLQLQMKNMNETEKIVRYSLQNGILRFDVSIADETCLTYDAFMNIYNKLFKDYDEYYTNENS